MAEKKDYKYYAFISYSRKNSKAATYFHRQLEHFRIPVKYVAEENRPPKQKFLRPIFRDRRDLEANENSFTEDIKKALERSRYLIVLCSPDSAVSHWVEEEVKYFLSTHDNDYNLIVPVILSGVPDLGSELECLSPSLRLREVMERNLPSMVPDEGDDEKSGWLNGVVQAMSYMLKVNRERIRATVDAERVRQAKIYSVIGVVCTIVFAGLAFWAIKAERGLREKNRRLDYVNFINEYVLDVESLGIDSSYRSMFLLLNNTNNILTSVDTKECVLRFVKKHGDSAIAGPETVSRMLKALRDYSEFELNKKMDLRIRCSQSLIFLGAKKADIYCELGTNEFITAERRNFLNKQLEEIDSREKTLEIYGKQLDLEIAKSQTSLQLQSGDDNLVEQVCRIDKSLKEKDYGTAKDVMRKCRCHISLLGQSVIMWHVIRDAPISQNMKIY